MFRQDPNEKYTNVGAAGRRFFSEGELIPHKPRVIADDVEGAVPIPSGGVVYLGFMQ